MYIICARAKASLHFHDFTLLSCTFVVKFVFFVYSLHDIYAHCVYILYILYIIIVFLHFCFPFLNFIRFVFKCASFCQCETRCTTQDALQLFVGNKNKALLLLFVVVVSKARRKEPVLELVFLGLECLASKGHPWIGVHNHGHPVFQVGILQPPV